MDLEEVSGGAGDGLGALLDIPVEEGGVPDVSVALDCEDLGDSERSYKESCGDGPQQSLLAEWPAGFSQFVFEEEEV